jgi:hypothetical protein
VFFATGYVLVDVTANDPLLSVGRPGEPYSRITSFHLEHSLELQS